MRRKPGTESRLHFLGNSDHSETAAQLRFAIIEHGIRCMGLCVVVSFEIRDHGVPTKPKMM